MIPDFRTMFMDWWNDFQNSDDDIIKDMIDTVEDSPYHREDNVYVHTQMVVNGYIERVDAVRTTWYYEDLQGAVACAFHDVGKPNTEEEFHSERYEKVIRTYHSHEVYSASLFMNAWCNNEFNVRSIIEDINAFYNTWVMIAYHLPYSMNDKNKTILKTHMEYFGITNVFVNVIQSDADGRTPDDKQSTIKRSEEWIKGFLDTDTIALREDRKTNGDTKIMVGVSASGKSQLTDSLQGVDVFSFDGLRTAMCPTADSYREIFQQFNDYFNDPDRDPMLIKERFNVGKGKHQYGQSEFLQLMLKNAITNAEPEDTLVIDNTNLSPKYRRVINMFNWKPQRFTEAIMFIRSLDELLDNEDSRNDYDRRGKGIIKSMYYRYHPVLIGEVDDVSLVPPRGYE